MPFARSRDHRLADVETAILQPEPCCFDMVGKRAVSAPVVVQGCRSVLVDDLEEACESQALRIRRIPIDASRRCAELAQLARVIVGNARANRRMRCVHALLCPAAQKVSMYRVASGPWLKIRSRIVTWWSNGGNNCVYSG